MCKALLFIIQLYNIYNCKAIKLSKTINNYTKCTIVINTIFYLWFIVGDFLSRGVLQGVFRFTSFYWLFPSLFFLGVRG